MAMIGFNMDNSENDVIEPCNKRLEPTIESY
jgi:hypothetical protein